MRIVKVENSCSQDYASLLARYARDNGETFDIHFTVGSDQADWLNDGSDCTFVVGVIFAFLLKENYQHNSPVDIVLQRNIRSLCRQWSQWYPHYHPIDIAAPSCARVAQRSRSIASFYSGGVDSLFTAVEHSPAVDVLISLEHEPFEKTAILRALSRLAELRAYPDATGKTHVRIVTNVMEALPEMLDMWAYMVHGPVLISIAHLLSKHVAAAALSSSYSYGDLTNWGSHPLTDPLVSSGILSGSNYGGTYSRIEKTWRIAKDELALKSLSVCGRGRLEGPFVNCSKCQKCIRTMMTLDLCGATPEQASSFDWSDYEPAMASKLFLRSVNEAIFFREIELAATKLGRTDIAAACSTAIKRSRPFTFLTKAELFIRRQFPSTLRHRARLLSARSKVYSALGLRRSMA